MFHDKNEMKNPVTLNKSNYIYFMRATGGFLFSLFFNLSFFVFGILYFIGCYWRGE